MSSTLVIQLQHNAENKQCWLIADSDGNITQSAAYDDLRTISKHCADKSIVVLIPADEVLLLSLTLPVMKKNRLQQAIPFAIEEQLSDKADTFHIILLNEQNTAGEIAIAAMEKKRIQYWYDLLRENNIEANYFIPSLLAMPYKKNTITIMESQQNCLVRSSKTSGFLTSKENLNALLNLHLNEIKAPKKIHIYQYGKITESIVLDKAHPIEIDTTKHEANACFQSLAQGALNNLNLNLLSGKLISKTKQQKVKRYWQLTLVFIVLIIAVSMINKIFQYNVYSTQNTKLTQSIDKLYKLNFPESTDIVAPKLRLQEKLKTVNSLADGNPYLNLIGNTGEIIKHSTRLNIQDIQFRNRTLFLTVSTANFSDLGEIINQLKANGLQVQQTNAHSQGKIVSTVLVIKELR